MSPPLEQVENLGPGYDPRQREEAGVEPPLRREERLRILLVDDEPEVLELFAAMLRRRGWEVVCAHDAREALDAWKEESFNVILMDIQMPEVSGLDASKVIRSREQRGETDYTPIVAVTAWSRPEFRRACREAGMDDFLPKPVSMAGLWSIVERNAKPAVSQ